jgi:hypothetical protein
MRMKMMITCVFGLAIALDLQLASAVVAPAPVKADDERGADLPKGNPELQAIQKRLGRPRSGDGKRADVHPLRSAER